jgi:hypothetical protein
MITSSFEGAMEMSRVFGKGDNKELNRLLLQTTRPDPLQNNDNSGELWGYRDCEGATHGRTSCKKAMSSRLWTLSQDRGRELLTPNLGKVNSTLLKYSTIAYDTGTTTAPLFSLPGHLS